ncbi:MAG: type II toxin-antitoxin system prevent-host-death family antitoxin [Candidatus Latescibacterota bacterium]
MSISEFKACALEVLAEVARSRESVLVTKRGAPLVQVVPLPVEGERQPGKLADALVFDSDIVSPLGAEMWEASR